ncbi:MAG TPA: PH domain-containing protein [Clostridia bacterium]|nr:PH domain-containing protein [Clostridia bacterium]
MRFPGKRGFWWYLVLAVLAAATIFSFWVAIREPGWISGISAGFMLLTLAFSLTIQFRNDLTLEADHLLLRFGPLTRRIPYLNIKSLTRTKNPLAATATSLDRLALELRDGGLYYVSAQDNDRLADELDKRRRQALKGE